jgi:hypothetical protein
VQEKSETTCDFIYNREKDIRVLDVLVASICAVEMEEKTGCKKICARGHIIQMRALRRHQELFQYSL